MCRAGGRIAVGSVRLVRRNTRKDANSRLWREIWLGSAKLTKRTDQAAIRRHELAHGGPESPLELRGPISPARPHGSHSGSPRSLLG